MKNSRWHSCNVLAPGAGERRVWKFRAAQNGVSEESVISVRDAEPLPQNLVKKTWQTIWQGKLNVAWLPAGRVFLKVLQLPAADLKELVSMVELQLEKISPIPVTQLAWTIEVLGQGADDQKTVVVIMASRHLVEEFLGSLEKQGFVTDRLELPILRRLVRPEVQTDGAWIHLQRENAQVLSVVAWREGGSLRNLTLSLFPDTPEGIAALEEQLVQTAWAGEVDGWLTSQPSWKIEGDDDLLQKWGSAIKKWAGGNAQLVTAPEVNQVAALTAQHGAALGQEQNLVPVEFLARYRQDFIDGLWMKILGAIVGAYIIGVAIYFIGVEVVQYQANSVTKEATALSGSYTNALQMKSKIQILQDQVGLRFAALDCFKAVADALPNQLTLTSLTFQRGQVLVLDGTGPSDQATKVIDFNDVIKGAAIGDRPLFKTVGPPKLDSQAGPSGALSVRWNFSCELNRPEIE